MHGQQIKEASKIHKYTAEQNAGCDSQYYNEINAVVVGAGVIEKRRICE